jgi:hypothetical protein
MREEEITFAAKRSSGDIERWMSVNDGRGMYMIIEREFRGEEREKGGDCRLDVVRLRVDDLISVDERITGDGETVVAMKLRDINMLTIERKGKCGSECRQFVFIYFCAPIVGAE